MKFTFELFLFVSYVVILLFLLILLLRGLASNSVISTLTIPILLRFVALGYFFAFWSLRVQIVGLIGQYGLIPLQESKYKLEKWLQDEEGKSKRSYLAAYINRSILLVWSQVVLKDSALDNLLLSGMLAAVVCLYLPHPIAFGHLYLVYLSMKRASGPFTNLQWDALLLEAGFLAFWLSLSSSWASRTLYVWLFQFLLFRLMFGSGICKLLSRDKSWKDGQAMTFHFLTQPLPSPIAKMVHNFPQGVLRGFTFATHFVEVIVPCLSLLGSSGVNTLAFLCYTFLQLGIGLTGHFGFFNFFSTLLGVSLLHGDVLCPLTFSLSSNCAPSAFSASLSVMSSSWMGWLLHLTMESVLFGVGVLVAASYGLALLFAIARYCSLTAYVTVPERIFQLYSELSLLYIGCHYGLFANMTKTRRELIVEARFVLEQKADSSKQKNDEESEVRKMEGIGKNAAYSEWLPIEFAFKPGDIHVGPKPFYSYPCEPVSIRPLSKTFSFLKKWMWPPLHLPRVDWLLWFSALKNLPTTADTAASPATRESGKPKFPSFPLWQWRLLLGIMNQSPQVMQLLHPCNQELFRRYGKPAEIRVLSYEYQFNYDDIQQPDDPWYTGQCNGIHCGSETHAKPSYWKRRLCGTVLPPCRPAVLRFIAATLNSDIPANIRVLSEKDGQSANVEESESMPLASDLEREGTTTSTRSAAASTLARRLRELRARRDAAQASISLPEAAPQPDAASDLIGRHLKERFGKKLS